MGREPSPVLFLTLQAEASSIDLPGQKGECDAPVKSSSMVVERDEEGRVGGRGKGREAGQLQERDEASNLLIILQQR